MKNSEFEIIVAGAPVEVEEHTEDGELFYFVRRPGHQWARMAYNADTGSLRLLASSELANVETELGDALMEREF